MQEHSSEVDTVPSSMPKCLIHGLFLVSAHEAHLGGAVVMEPAQEWVAPGAQALPPVADWRPAQPGTPGPLERLTCRP